MGTTTATCSARAGWDVGVGERDRLDLDQSIGIVEERDAEQRVRGALICAGEADEMHDDAKRAAEEIPGARSVSRAGHSHIPAFYEADDLLLPHILELLHSATPTP
jgi:hypothetical protein